MIGEFVVIRTYSAGVHCGILKESNGTAVILTDARRIWRWRGANTLHEISLYGIDMGYSRISEPVASILITQVIEAIPCTPTAEKNLRQSRWPN
jgi:hypothetical protein